MPLPEQHQTAADDGEQPNGGNQTVGPAPDQAVIHRNFDYMRPDQYKRGNTIVQAVRYITSQSSPVKGSASNPAAGQGQTKGVVDEALREELGGARILADDLIEQMFGSIISTELAMRILEGLLQTGKVQVRDSRGKIPSNATAALKNAYERALAHGCTPEGVEVIKTPAKKGKGSHRDWTWTWIGYPTGILDEGEVVDYFNEVIDACLTLPCLADVLKERQALYRFVLPCDTTCGFPLAYGPQKEDMRPDFVVLPLKGLHIHKPDTQGGVVRYTAQEKYCNFTMVRLPGECKTSDHNTGTAQVQRYMRGTRRSQPWQRFTTAMSVTRKSVGFMRGEGSGIERVFLEPEYGRSSLEFVRLLLGIALADEETFGKSRYFELAEEDQMLESSSLDSTAMQRDGDNAIPTSNEVLPNAPALRRSDRVRKHEPQSRQASSGKEVVAQQDSGSSSGSSQPPPTPLSSAHSSHHRRSGDEAITNSSSHASRSSQKRKREDDDDEYVDRDTAPRPKKKADKKAMYTIQAPTKAFGYNFKGLLFNNASIRGRGTVVWVGQDPSDNAGKVIALKMSWQDVSRKDERDKVLEILSQHNPHENVLRPTKLAIEEDSTLRTIRAFTLRESEHWGRKFEIEDRVLEVHVTALARPVEFFWSVQDFVKGVRGAILGHAYLVSIGILHRDISENNVVLGLHPDGPRGYIMDFDMAVPYSPPSEEALQHTRTRRRVRKAKQGQEKQSGESRPSGPFKAERTGTTPYMAIDVLLGKGHTHYDDIESFFYVLLLFFMTYTHPLPESDLRTAHTKNFTQSITASTRPHLKCWSDYFQTWDGEHAAEYKIAYFNDDKGTTMFLAALEERWAHEDLVDSIDELAQSCWHLFQPYKHGVSHEKFVEALDQWLADYPVPPDGYNHCPFKDSQNKQYV